MRYFCTLLGTLWLMSVSMLAAAGVSSQPSLASVQAAAAEVGASELLVSKNARRQVPIASLTKLMTALVIMESGLDLKEWLTFETRHVEASANAWSRIRVGSELPRGEVMKIALMSSENFAAYTLARTFPGGFEAFVTAMNAKAKALGMSGTHFVDPTGLSTDNVSTAADLIKLANAALQYPEIREASTTGYHRAWFRGPRYSLSFGNTNALVHRDSWGVTLSKTGYLNEAGRCLVMVSKMNGKPVVTVLLDSLGTRSPLGDAGRIKRWLATGQPGSVAAAAQRYAEEKNQALSSPAGQATQAAQLH